MPRELKCAYADEYIAMHLSALANGKVYSELSADARAATDPTEKAKLDGLVQTAFRGETLRSMLNQAWAFSIFGSIGIYAAFGLLVAALVILGALVYELFLAKKPIEETSPSRTLATSPSRA